MPWRTKLNHQDCSFTHKVQGFPSEVNDSYIYIYLYAEFVLENTDTSSLVCDFACLFPPLVRYALQWMRQTKAAVFIQPSIQSNPDFLPSPALTHVVRQFNSPSSRSTSSNKASSFAIYPLGSKISIRYLYFFVICWTLTEFLNNYWNLVGTSHSQVLWNLHFSSNICLLQNQLLLVITAHSLLIINKPEASSFS